MLTAANNLMNAQVFKKTDYDFRIHLYGDSQVGKTSIMEKYFDNQFQEIVDEATKAKNAREKKLNKINFRVSTSHTEQDYGDDFDYDDFENSDACMIAVASDSRRSFDSIDSWTDLIRSADEKERPICLLLVDKNEEDESKKVVTEADIK